MTKIKVLGIYNNNQLYFNLTETMLCADIGTITPELSSPSAIDRFSIFLSLSVITPEYSDILELEFCPFKTTVVGSLE